MFEQVTSKRDQQKVVKKEYKAHYLPTGCTSVPMYGNSNTDTNRSIHHYEDWIFHQKGWELEEPIHQNGSDSIPLDAHPSYVQHKEFLCAQQPLEAILFKSGSV
eukprot:7637106-Ditylum_brightwellii.AAC.1